MQGDQGRQGREKTGGKTGDMMVGDTGIEPVASSV